MDRKPIRYSEVEVYVFFCSFMAVSGGIPPTFREIVDGTSIASTSAISYILTKLSVKGWMIDNGKGRARFRFIPAGGEYIPPKEYMDMVEVRPHLKYGAEESAREVIDGTRETKEHA